MADGSLLLAGWEDFAIIMVNTHIPPLAMVERKKGIVALTASAFALGSILFAPTAEAYVREATARPSAPSREQEQIQLQLAEKTRNLAEQYTNRRFGTEENPVLSEPEEVPVQESEPVDAALQNVELRRSQRERFTSTVPSSSDVQMGYAPPAASTLASVGGQTESVAANLPKLPRSGVGLSVAAVALGLSGALRGRKKFGGAQ